MNTETELEPLPTLAPQGETEPLAFYRFRALSFLLDTGCYASLDDHALESAFSASQSAIAGPLDDRARERIVQVRRMILLVLAHRDAYRKACARDTVTAETAEALQEGIEALPTVSQSDQALKLLRAALTLILGDNGNGNGDGGSRVPIHPKPSAPGPSTALPIPKPSAPDIRF